MRNYTYISEDSSFHKAKAVFYFLFGCVLFLVAAFLFYWFWDEISQTIPLIGKVFVSLNYNLTNTTPLGLFYGHFLGGLFFVPSADELIFYYGLLNGNSLLFSFIAALSGYLLAQLVNYVLGYNVGAFLLHLVSKRKVYRTKRWINKYGAYGIFVFNITPLPAPLLTFALGVTKYNFRRLFLITIVAKTLEYLVIIAAFSIIT